MGCVPHLFQVVQAAFVPVAADRLPQIQVKVLCGADMADGRGLSMIFPGVKARPVLNNDL